MGSEPVVILDPSGQLPDDLVGVGEIGAADIVALDRVDEGFGHTVGLGAVRRGRDGLKAESLGIEHCLRGYVGATVVREPLDLDGRLQSALTEAGPESAVEQEADIVTVEITSSGDVIDRLPIVAVQCEGHAHGLSVPARDVEPVGAPALIGSRHGDPADRCGSGHRRAQGARGATPVEAAIKGRELRDSNLSEKMAFFEAYGLLCGDAGVPLLDGILHAKGFMGKRDDSELRACAATALGKINTPKAMETLNRAVGEKDVIVRNAVSRAIRGAGA